MCRNRSSLSGFILCQTYLATCVTVKFNLERDAIVFESAVVWNVALHVIWLKCTNEILVNC